MSTWDSFWEHVDHQLERLKSARTADQVMEILDKGQQPGAAFFSGSGGDEQVIDSLLFAGWRTVWIEADYYWCARSPDGKSFITYIEGDVFPELQKRVGMDEPADDDDGWGES